MIFLLVGCLSPQKASEEHTTALCTYLTDCDILISYGYENAGECENDQTLANPENLNSEQVKLLDNCTDSLYSADCIDVYNENIYLTDACTDWSNSSNP